MSRDNIDFWSLFCIEKKGAPPGWTYRSLEVIEDDSGSFNNHVIVKGYVHNGTRFKTGLRAGELKPRCPIPGTERQYVVKIDDLRQFEHEWERRTGKCSTCCGNGTVIHSSSTHGEIFETVYRPCRNCSGIGRINGDAL